MPKEAVASATWTSNIERSEVAAPRVRAVVRAVGALAAAVLGGHGDRRRSRQRRRGVEKEAPAKLAALTAVAHAERVGGGGRG